MAEAVRVDTEAVERLRELAMTGDATAFLAGVDPPLIVALVADWERRGQALAEVRPWIDNAAHDSDSAERLLAKIDAALAAAGTQQEGKFCPDCEQTIVGSGAHHCLGYSVAPPGAAGQLAHLERMEAIEREVFPDSQPRSEVVVSIVTPPGAAEGTPECVHEWIDARNEYVLSGELCAKCSSLRCADGSIVPGVPARPLPLRGAAGTPEEPPSAKDDAAAFMEELGRQDLEIDRLMDEDDDRRAADSPAEPETAEEPSA